MGWPIELTLDERAALRADVIRGVIKRSDIKRMNLAPIDRIAAEMHLPRARSASLAQQTPPEVARIAEEMQKKASPPFADPVLFLLRGDENRVANILHSDDFAVVMQWRAKQGDQNHE
jgi:hypothetical protein